MTKPTLNSSDSLPNQEVGATCGELAESTDSLWRPSWLHWLISALSGTVEIEKQTAWLKKSNEEERIAHEQRMKDLRKETEEMKRLESEKQRQHEQQMQELSQQNAKLAELESKLDIVLQSSDSSLIPTSSTDNS